MNSRNNGRGKSNPSKTNFKRNWGNKYSRGNRRGVTRNFHERQVPTDDDRDFMSETSLLSGENSCNEVFVLDPDTVQGPYQAWKAYLPGEPYDEHSELIGKLKIIEKYVNKIVTYKRQEIEKRQSFGVCVKMLCNDENFIANWPDFLADLKNTPRQVISSFGLVMHHIIHQEMMREYYQDSLDAEKDSVEELDLIEKLPMIHARFFGFDIMPLKNLKTNTYKKFVSVRGTVVRVGNVRPLCTKLAFQCNKCECVQIILQPCGNYTMPNRCTSKSCFSKSFQPLLSSPRTEMVPWQNIRLQELASDENYEKGRVPRTVECELTQDLVDRCVPGDIVTLSGIVKINDPNEKSFGEKQKNKASYILYILANSIECLKEKYSDSLEAMPGGIQLNMSDLYAVKDIHAKENLFSLIVASLCPNIYGHEIVKAGLILSLFGGTQRHLDADNKVPVRGDSHVLIVGDPGLGKSQMLLACANVSPRGVYVCGNTTTSSGLTVTVSKDTSGESCLDAGALVLADQGCCCIDEFDKMTSQHHALLEAMEQQTISIAKGGISCMLPARTSVIAAANPVGGHYNKAKTVAENIKLSSALLSRFDLVFILVDKADAEHDSKVSSHVMAMHMKNTFIKTALSIMPKLGSTPSDVQLLNGKNQLIDKLRLNTCDETQIIPAEMLRKYISYARKYVHPKLLPEASCILQKFYLELREQHQSPRSTPITNRQLESMIRLTEARARSELREVCTAEDAEEVVEIVKFSMVNTCSDEFGKIDFERSIHGSGMSKRSKVKTLLNALTKTAAQNNNNFFTLQQLEGIARDVHIEGVKDLIEGMNDHGYLIKKGPKLYQLLEL